MTKEIYNELKLSVFEKFEDGSFSDETKNDLLNLLEDVKTYNKIKELHEIITKKEEELKSIVSELRIKQNELKVKQKILDDDKETYGTLSDDLPYISVGFNCFDSRLSFLNRLEAVKWDIKELSGRRSILMRVLEELREECKNLKMIKEEK